MKKIALVLTFVCACCLFSGNVSASTLILPYSLPAIVGSNTYTDVLAVPYGDDWKVKYFNVDTNYEGYTVIAYADYAEPVGIISTGSPFWHGPYFYCTSGNCSQNPTDYTSSVLISGWYTCFSEYQSTIDIQQGVPGYDYSTWKCNAGNITGGTVVRTANIFRLSITVAPENSGTVGLYPSGGTYLKDAEVDLAAIPAEGWAFGYWDNGTTCLYDNPLTVTMDSAKNFTAKFFKTFRNAVGDFRFDVNTDRGERGECVLYVRDETDISSEGCHGNAEDCLGLAQTAGYSTGNIPKVGAIAVFSSSTFPDAGHVGIVKEIISETSIVLRHSNYSTYHTVSEETINLTNYPVAGYIYPTYPMP